MSKRIGLPVTLKMRHDAHYVESLTSYSGAAIGTNDPGGSDPSQSGSAAQGDGRFARTFGFHPREGRARAAAWCGSCRARTATTSFPASGGTTLRVRRACARFLASRKWRTTRRRWKSRLIENIQRKDLTPFEEADGLHRLATQFEYTHEDVAKKIGRARSSVTETLSLRNIPESLRKKCVEHGIISKSLLLQIARQPTEKKMIEMMHRILQGGLTRDEARRERRDEQGGPQRPQPFIFQFEPENETLQVPHSV